MALVLRGIAPKGALVISRHISIVQVSWVGTDVHATAEVRSGRRLCRLPRPRLILSLLDMESGHFLDTLTHPPRLRAFSPVNKKPKAREKRKSHNLHPPTFFSFS